MSGLVFHNTTVSSSFSRAKTIYKMNHYHTMLVKLVTYIGSLCINVNVAQDPVAIHIESNAENNNDDNHANAKEIEEKGGFHFAGIVLITMVTLNVLFVFYCCIKEKTRNSQKGRSKYLAVSGDEFQFDEDNMDADIENMKMRQNEEVQASDIEVENKIISDDHDS